MLPAVSGTAPCPQVPGHGGIQGAGVSERIGSGSVVFESVKYCVKCGSSASQFHVKTCGSSSRLNVRVKFSLKRARQVRAKFALNVGQVRYQGWVKSPGRGVTSLPRDVGARVSQGHLKLIPGPFRKPTMGEPIRRCSTRHPLGIY